MSTNEKTPDEIKKGLGCCLASREDCGACPYNGEDCRSKERNRDALAYIQQLERDINDIIEERELNEYLRDKVKQLEAEADLAEQYRWERDVAVGQLEQLGIGFGEKVNGKFPRWISVAKKLPKRGEFVLLQYAKNAQNPTLHARNTMAVGRYECGMFIVEGCCVKVTQPPKEE